MPKITLQACSSVWDQFLQLGVGVRQKASRYRRDEEISPAQTSTTPNVTKEKMVNMSKHDSQDMIFRYSTPT